MGSSNNFVEKTKRRKESCTSTFRIDSILTESIRVVNWSVHRKEETSSMAITSQILIRESTSVNVGWGNPLKQMSTLLNRNSAKWYLQTCILFNWVSQLLCQDRTDICNESTTFGSSWSVSSLESAVKSSCSFNMSMMIHVFLKIENDWWHTLIKLSVYYQRTSESDDFDGVTQNLNRKRLQI